MIAGFNFRTSIVYSGYGPFISPSSGGPHRPVGRLPNG